MKRVGINFLPRGVPKQYSIEYNTWTEKVLIDFLLQDIIVAHSFVYDSYLMHILYTVFYSQRYLLECWIHRDGRYHRFDNGNLATDLDRLDTEVATIEWEDDV